MADVYKAKDHKLNRFVAIKVLKQEFKNDRNFVSKFRVEAQAAAGLSHPNIVNVFDVGEDRGASFIVMELVEGITLKTYISKKGKLSPREASSIMLQVAAGLEAAHNNGIIHRDVKPQNIIISLDGKAKIADFGIARAASANTITSSAMGSVHYCAPEQTRGGYSDSKSDIYALGITMYEMLTGHVPFDGDSTVEVALKHLQEEIPSPRRAVPEIPRSTEQIVLRCTQKSPDRRYANMSELIRDLKESLVNPDGDFVRIPTVDRKAQTVLFSREELNQIKKQSAPIYPENTRPELSGSYQELNARSYQQRMDYPPEDDRTQTESGVYYEEYQGRREPERYEERERRPQRREEVRRRPTTRKPEPDDTGAERVVTIITVVGAVVVGLVILFFAARAAGFIGTNNKQTNPTTPVTETAAAKDTATMPDLRGKTESEAKQMLSDLKLGYEFQGESPSDTYEKGLVTSQSVDPGTEVKLNSTVGYVLSSGASDTAVTVPNLADKTQAEAEAALTAMGLRVSIDNSRYSDTVTAGNVITTNPGAGSSAAAGSTVILYISQGSSGSTVEVPGLVGHYVDDASKALTNQGLYMYITQQHSETVAQGLIISQDIDEGTLVESGTTVTVTVSSGPEKSEDITILDTDGVWRCNAQLNAPEGWNGEPVRIDLVQNETTTTIYEGTTGFPYLLSVEGQPGVASGTVYVYTLDPSTWEVIATTTYSGITFSEVE